MFQKLLKLAEDKLNRGTADKWTNYDFEQASEAILEVTGVQLSVTTLKRIWGKVKYPHDPAIQTLNTLAQFTGFNDWRDFEQKNKDKVIKEEPVVVQQEPSSRGSTRKWRKYFVVAVAVLVFVIVYAGFKLKGQPEIDPSGYSFSLSKVKLKGVPNSVVFTYDASKSPSDSVYIVQTWDVRRKTLVPKDGTKHTAIYYYPGFFNTKLIIDSTIVKRQDLQVSSDGWLGLVEAADKPIYFTKEEVLTTNGMRVNDSLLRKYGFSLQPTAPKVRFFNQRDMGTLMNDNFDFETVLRNPDSSAGNLCHFVEVLIQGKDAIIIIPLGDKSCIGDMLLAFDGKFASSRHNDLSGFGGDLTQWTKLRVVCRNRHAQIFVNDTLAFELDAPDEPKGIVGVQYRFNGPGEIKYSRFWNKSGKLIEVD